MRFDAGGQFEGSNLICDYDCLLVGFGAPKPVSKCPTGVRVVCFATECVRLGWLIIHAEPGWVKSRIASRVGSLTLTLRARHHTP